MVTAIVLMESELGQVEAAAQALLALPEVSEVYSVAGEYDLVAIVRVRAYEQMAQVVPHRLAQIPGIRRTHTLMAFQAYARHDLERLWTVGLDEEAARGTPSSDGVAVLSPCARECSF